jgi:hypothetical protein
MNPYPVFVLLPSFGTNILAKFVVNFVLHEGRRTRTGYSFVSRCFALVRVRARVRIIHKQRHMGRHVQLSMPTIMCRRQKLSSTPSSSYFVVLLCVYPKSPCMLTFPVGGNRSTRKKPTTFGRALTDSFHTSS